MTRSGYLLDLVVFFEFGGAAVAQGAVQPGAVVPGDVLDDRPPGSSIGGPGLKVGQLAFDRGETPRPDSRRRSTQLIQGARTMLHGAVFQDQDCCSAAWSVSHRLQSRRWLSLNRPSDLARAGEQVGGQLCKSRSSSRLSALCGGRGGM